MFRGSFGKKAFEKDSNRTRVHQKLGNSLRTIEGITNIGDNVATGILRITTPVHTGDLWAELDINVFLRFVNVVNVGGKGYASVAEMHLIALRSRYESAAYYMGGTVTMIAQADAGSASASYADVGTATVTVATDTTNHRWDIKVQADVTGTAPPTHANCSWYAEIFTYPDRRRRYDFLLEAL